MEKEAFITYLENVLAHLKKISHKLMLDEIRNVCLNLGALTENIDGMIFRLKNSKKEEE